jgi:TRAP transporter TAXI family solute receptor
MRLLATVCALSLALSGPALAQTKRISIATGGTGGAYYPIGGGLANMISKRIHGVEVTAEVTGGGVDNIKLIRSGRADLGFTNASIVQNAIAGADKFTGGPVKLRTLAAIYPNRMHVVTVEGRGIATMTDLKGRRVSTGAPGSGTEVIAFRIMEAFGLDKDKDIRRERLSATESVNALKDGKIDAFIFGGALPVAAITDLAATPGIKIKLVDHGDAVDRMNAKYGNILARGAIPAHAYPGHAVEVSAVDVYDLIVVGEMFDEELAYKIAKLMFESRPDLIAIHKNMEFLEARNQQKLATAPVHPGVLRYLKEVKASD